MRHLIRRRVWKHLFWGLVGTLGAAGLLLALAYSYATDGASLVAKIRKESPKFLPGSFVAVERARVHPFIGEIKLEDVAVWQGVDGLEKLALRVGGIKINCDLGELVHGRIVPREVVIGGARLRVFRRKDGTWNLKGLLADPWPGPAPGRTPTVLVQNSSVELVEDDGTATPILRDVSVRVEAASGPGPLKFQLKAGGADLFDGVDLEGTFDPGPGTLVLDRGDLNRLVISNTLRGRLPAEFRPGFDKIGLTAGEIDLAVSQLEWTPAHPETARYNASARLLAGTWACSKLPFPLNDVSAVVTARDGKFVVERAEGGNGKTSVHAKGEFSLDTAAKLDVWVNDLEIDRRIRDWTPPEFAEVWTDFKPAGDVGLALRLVKPASGEPDFGLRVDCKDVAMEYKHFPYPLEHASGTLTWKGMRQITVDARANVGGKPATCVGTIFQPGPDARVSLKFRAEAFPVDEAFFKALPKDVRPVVAQFHPSGRVRVDEVVVNRVPWPGGPPEGKVAVDALLTLTTAGQCAIRWDGLPYPVSQVTGSLEMHTGRPDRHPDHWIVKDMRGWNNMASVHGGGRVDLVRPGRADGLKVALELAAAHLPFDEELRLALPTEWRAPWAILNPRGMTAVTAKIDVKPEAPPHYHVEIRPEPETRISLELANGAANGGPLKFPAMEDIAGTFIYNDGPVTMTGVKFNFRGAPVEFRSGDVQVWDTGRFALRVANLYVRNFRIDAPLRQMMPPVMAQFAHRLDEARTLAFRTDLGLGWSGKTGDSPRCLWSDGLVILNDNAIQAGLPVEHIQGQVADVGGSFDGKALTAHGILDLASVSMMGQQITQLKAPLKLASNRATLGVPADPLRGNLLDGQLAGTVAVGLEATPTYESDLTVTNADLRALTKTIAGKQTFRGLVSGRLVLSGMGYDVHTIQGQGEAHIAGGALGELPSLLPLFKLLSFSKVSKTAFDSVDVALRIRDGKTYLDPIKITGDLISLRGRGTLDTQGQLDLRLRALYGRDAWHVPVLGDLVRAASANIFDIHATGPIGSPHYELEALPVAAGAAGRLAQPTRDRFKRQ